jgi:ribosomal protein S18 acetylase RimI-like enzyme
MSSGAADRPATGGIVVRAARAADLERLVEWNLGLARETEDRELPVAVLRRAIERAHGAPARGRYFVAESGGEAAGALLVTTEWSDWRDGWLWWIQSVYVDPAHRGRGAYRALHEHVRAEARARGDVAGLRLYVERDNERAQRLYRSLGMEETAYRLYEEILRSG